MLVATIAYTIQFVFYEPHGPIIALIIASPVVPLIDLVFNGEAYRWDKPSGRTLRQAKGVLS